MAQNKKTDPRSGGFTEEDVLKGATTRYRRRSLGKSGMRDYRDSGSCGIGGIYADSRLEAASA